MIYELTLSGPAKNALGSEMMDFILHNLGEADGRPVLVTGAGDAFSAGLNLKEVMSLERDQMAAFLRKLESMCAALYHYPGPSVAYVNGHAIAGGCLVALACDMRVAAASPSARIGLNEVALGLRFPPNILDLVRSRVPVHFLDRVVLGAGLFDPHEAQRLGLVDEVTEGGIEVARQRLMALATHPADGYAAAKRDLRGGFRAMNDMEARRFAEEIVPTWTSNELKTRIMKIFKK